MLTLSYKPIWKSVGAAYVASLKKLRKAHFKDVRKWIFLTHLRLGMVIYDLKIVILQVDFKKGHILR